MDPSPTAFYGHIDKNIDTFKSMMAGAHVHLGEKLWLKNCDKWQLFYLGEKLWLRIHHKLQLFLDREKLWFRDLTDTMGNLVFFMGEMVIS